MLSFFENIYPFRVPECLNIVPEKVFDFTTEIPENFAIVAELPLGLL